MLKRIAFVILLIASLLAGCAAAATQEYVAVAPSYPNDVGSKSVSDGGATGFAPANEPAANYYGTANQTVSGADAGRMVIKNANISLYVDDPIASSQRISKMAETMGGFVVSANVVQTQLNSGVQVPHASVAIRIPAEKLEEAMNTIRAETTQPVISENISSQDVTGEYTDLQSRLRNLEAAEAQLQKIMDSANKTEDVLAVYNQLVQTREQIEVIKGQMKYYEESAALSMVNVDLTANAAVQPVSVGGWQPVGVAKDALQALINTLQGLTNVLIVIGVFLLPLAIILLVPVVLIFWVVRAVIRRRKAK